MGDAKTIAEEAVMGIRQAAGPIRRTKDVRNLSF